MTLIRNESDRTFAAWSVGLVGPPAVAHGISLMLPHRDLDVLSILVIEIAGIAAAAFILRPRWWSLVLAAAVYIPSMFILISWIGNNAGYYDLS